VVGSLMYSLVRLLLDVLTTSHSDQAKLQAEVLALRRLVQVLERQIKRVHWRPAIGWSWRRCANAFRDRAGRDSWSNRRRRSAGTAHWCKGSGQLIRPDRAVAGRPSGPSAVS